ncbi:hypothetical protein Wcon_01141 [Wolbachia endosymbiont of Cylisticus convexus]|uniref:hypothetical protein n=1 Tax=Wolbachia endosymbiont of Cylisticus convexus TaxID=118728 RepID=UPI000DF6C896|nr:hypothetical protein [Wolbachia endosymbiont of Cylisticus convexus]RDD34745.1 hypothetical protein Wcon_01141 [Wolbachia endosymbiont of Cylisticus convexus]
MQQIGKNLQVISYSQASRRLKKLNLKICDYRTDKSNIDNIEIAIDGTVIVSVQAMASTISNLKPLTSKSHDNAVQQVRSTFSPSAT